jgi:hypothetical protein
VPSMEGQGRSTAYYRSVDEVEFLQVTVTLTRHPSSSVGGWGRGA